MDAQSIEYHLEKNQITGCNKLNKMLYHSTMITNALNEAMEKKMNDLEYAGFWIRTTATIIDSILIVIIILPLLIQIYGADYWQNESYILGFWDIVLNFIFPACTVFVFWHYKSATPGKMLCNLTIIDAKSGQKPSTGQLIGRYLGYYVSIIPIFMGFIWVGIDMKKQGWHDKLAGTIVIKSKK